MFGPEKGDKEVTEDDSNTSTHGGDNEYIQFCFVKP